MVNCKNGFSDGTPKGMMQILEKREVNVSKMKTEDMREKLQSLHDFKYEKTKVETLLLNKGIMDILYQNFIVS